VELLASGAALFPVEGSFEAGAETGGITVSASPEKQSLRVDPGLSYDGIAWASLSDQLATTGWMELLVETTGSQSVQNDVKMYAAGYAEGVLTAGRLAEFHSNLLELLKDKGEALENVQKELALELDNLINKSELRETLSARAPEDRYWRQARYSLLQLWGIKDGYNAVASAKGASPLQMQDLLLVNSQGTLGEMLVAYSPQAVARRAALEKASSRSPASRIPLLLQRGSTLRAQAALPQRGSGQNRTAARLGQRRSLSSGRLSERAWERRLAHTGHCSALVRLASQGKDLLFGHTTWNDYSTMTRVFKYYHFRLPGSSAAASLVALSSYPGCISSNDNFFMMDSGLAVADTSIEILDDATYDRILDFGAPTAIPYFVHISAVNRLAQTASHWTSLLTERAGRASSAQWVVVDYNKFAPGERLRSNTVRLAEVVPGLAMHGDLSEELELHGYFASVNRPFFKKVREISGHAAAEKEYGALYSFDHGPRAEIFHRLGKSVETLMDMRYVMNRNDPSERVDPPSPGHAVSARMDLDGSMLIPNGGIDAKVVNNCLFRKLQCQAISGPSHDQQPAFSWTAFAEYPHLGLPDTWNFNWVQMTRLRLLPAPVDELQCPGHSHPGDGFEG
jgi:hypothetical protein